MLGVAGSAIMQTLPVSRFSQGQWRRGPLRQLHRTRRASARTRVGALRASRARSFAPGEVSRRKALGMAAKFGLGGAAAAALGAGAGTTSVREALAAAGLPQKPYKITFVNHAMNNHPCCARLTTSN